MTKVPATSPFISRLPYLLPTVVIACLAAFTLASVIYLGVKHRAQTLLAGHDWQRVVNLAEATEVFDRNQNKLGEFSDERRYAVGLASLPPHVYNSVLAAEDADFFAHRGFSISGIVRSAWVNLRGGQFKQGASTITQQLIRNIYLSKSKTIRRKLDELILAYELERLLSKNRILELYLNTVYFGNQSYGIEAAARNYFRKSATDLNLAESSLLAGVLSSPSRLAPHKNLNAAKTRRIYVLKRMVKNRFIGKDDALEALTQTLDIAKAALNRSGDAPYVLQAIAQELGERVLLSRQKQTGLTVETGLDATMQRVLQRELNQQLNKNFPNGGIRLEDTIEAAGLAVDFQRHEILAMVGGRNFSHSQFNRTTLMARPLGSMFMPFYFGLALDRGFQLNSSMYSQNKNASLLSQFDTQSDLSLFDGLRFARANEAARLFSWIGVGTVAEETAKLGFDMSDPDLSLALGRTKANLLQLTNALSAFSGDGRGHPASLVTVVRDRNGQSIYQSNAGASALVYSPEAVYMIRQALAQYQWQPQYAKQAERLKPMSFMAGTDAGLHDGWFVGFDDQFCLAIWQGSEFGRRRLAASEAELRAQLEATWLSIYHKFPSRQPAQMSIPEGISFTRITDTKGIATVIPIKTGTETRQF